MTKYKSTPIPGRCYYGYSHRSTLEAAVCQLIRFRELAGELVHHRHEVTFLLSEARFKYIADFVVLDVKKNHRLVIEAKGFKTKRWSDIVRMWRAYGVMPLEEWGGNWRRPVLMRTIVPEPGGGDGKGDAV